MDGEYHAVLPEPTNSSADGSARQIKLLLQLDFARDGAPGWDLAGLDALPDDPDKLEVFGHRSLVVDRHTTTVGELGRR